MLPARNIVLDSFNKREAFHPSKSYIFFDKTCPWKSHLYDIEKENDCFGSIAFAFYRDGRGLYRIQAVSVSSSSFDNRVSIHKDFRGLRGEELNKAAEINDGEFIHMAGFIGGCWSLESCLKIADISMTQHQAEQEAKKQA